MIRRLQVLNFRCLRHVDIQMDRFHVLIGPNASGKSTLFDAIAFLGDLVSDGLEVAVGKRTSNFRDLVWGRPDGEIGFELAIEVDVPEELRERLPPEKNFRVFRYEGRGARGPPLVLGAPPWATCRNRPRSSRWPPF